MNANSSSPDRPRATRLKVSRSSGNADGGWTGIGTSSGFTAGDGGRPRIGASRAPSTTAVEWHVAPQGVILQRRPPLSTLGIEIAERKATSLAGPSSESLGSGASVPKNGLNSRGGSIGISNEPIDRLRVRGEAKFASRSLGVGGFVYRNQPVSSRQACTENRMQNWTDDRKQTCTEGRSVDCRNVRKHNCTEFGRRNCAGMGHGPRGSDRQGRWNHLPGTSSRSSSRISVKNSKPQQFVEEIPSWLNVVKPHRGLRISEEERSSSELRKELVAVQGRDDGIQIPQGVLLDDEQQWPPLIDPRNSGLSVPKRAEDGPLKQHDEETEKRAGKYVPDAMLLMLNKDFIVSSPVKQNLLLTLSLTERKCSKQQQILVGHFTAFSSYLHFVLGRDATRVRTESNAGGTSTISESLSVEYFVRRFQAKDVVTEMEVEYCALNWKKVDYICTIYGQRVGVSVTRAMSFPNPKDFSKQMAYRLLYKKLFGLVVARHGVSKRHSFSQCMLHVWCETPETSCILQQEYEGVSKELDIVDDVIMVLTVAKGWHARSIFYESILKNVAL